MSLHFHKISMMHVIFFQGFVHPKDQEKEKMKKKILFAMPIILYLQMVCKYVVLKSKDLPLMIADRNL